MKKFYSFLKKPKYLTISFLLVFSLTFFSSFDSDDFEIAKNLDVFYSLFREVNLFYVDETDPGDMIKTSIDKMLEELDPYTVYIPESNLEDYKFMTTGQYGGIGALVRKIDNYVVIAEPYGDSPAIKSGLRAGDRILEIDGRAVEGKNTEDISNYLKGQPNTQVEIKIERPGASEKLVKTITREEIKIKPVSHYDMLTNEIGYINLNQFTMDCSSDFREAFVDLKQNKNMKSLVIDLRNNPGGLLIEAVKLMNFFVPKGQEIVNTKGKVKQWNKSYKTMMPSMDTIMPIVVLVNRSSASSSEIVAGSMQDLDRGIIIGERTFGKGLVQSVRELSYNSKLKVTTGKYYIPSGRCIQALDYSHRNEDGSVGKIPDSLTTEFTTKNGRLVYDGGGIVPDIKIEREKLSNVAVQLLASHLYFDFATEYFLKHDTIASAKNFEISDDTYQEFVEFALNHDFDYETESIKQLNKLKKIAREEKYFDLAEEEFSSLETKLLNDKRKDMNVFQEEISEILAQEIVSRYYYQIGRVENSFKFDIELEKAIEILSDNSEYESILTQKDSIK